MGKVTIDYKDLKNLIEDGFLKTKKYKRKNNGKRYKFSKNEIKRAVRLRDAYNQQKASSNHMQGSMITQPQMNHNMDTQNAIAIREAVQKMNGLSSNQFPAIENGPNRFDDKIKPIMDRMDDYYRYGSNLANQITDFKHKNADLARHINKIEDNIDNYMHGGNANKPTSSLDVKLISTQVPKTRFSDIEEKYVNKDVDDNYEDVSANDFDKIDHTFDEFEKADSDYIDEEKFIKAEENMYNVYPTNDNLKSNLNLGKVVYGNPISSELKFVPNEDKGFAEEKMNEDENLNSRFDDNADLYNYDSSPIGEFSKNDIFGSNDISPFGSDDGSLKNNAPLSVSAENDKQITSTPPLSVSVNNPPSMILKNEEPKDKPKEKQKETPREKQIVNNDKPKEKPIVNNDKPEEKSSRLRGLNNYNELTKERLKTELIALGVDYKDSMKRNELYEIYRKAKSDKAKSDKAKNDRAKKSKKGKK